LDDPGSTGSIVRLSPRVNNLLKIRVLAAVNLRARGLTTGLAEKGIRVDDIRLGMINNPVTYKEEFLAEIMNAFYISQRGVAHGFV